MRSGDKRSQRYLDELDRRSSVSLSDAMRARDVSRPIEISDSTKDEDEEATGHPGSGGSLPVDS